MDLSAITAGNTTVEIKHPSTFEPIGLSVELRASTSPEVEAVRRKFMNENLRQRAKNVTAEKVEANQIEVLIAAIAGWSWGKDAKGEDASWGGEKLECTPANVRRVLREAKWIKGQIDDAFGDEAAFFQS